MIDLFKQVLEGEGQHRSDNDRKIGLIFRVLLTHYTASYIVDREFGAYGIYVSEMLGKPNEEIRVPLSRGDWELVRATINGYNEKTNLRLITGG